MEIEKTDDILVHHNTQTQALELKFNRPTKKNAISLDMYRKLSEALQHAATDPSIKSVLITGSDTCFTAGNDLADFSNIDNITNKNNPIFVFMKTLMAMPKPIVAGVSGNAVGIGTTLLLHCDLVFCDSSAQFSMPFVKLGLCPEFGSSFLIPKLAGIAKANEWLLLGEPFTAAQAEQAGVINRVVQSPYDEAKKTCEKIALLPPNAVKNTKALLKNYHHDLTEKVVEEEIALFAKALLEPEFKEAAYAFFAKKKN